MRHYWLATDYLDTGVQHHLLHLQHWGSRCRLGRGELLGCGMALAEAELRLRPAQALQTMAGSREAAQPQGLLAAWVQRWDIPTHVEKLQTWWRGIRSTLEATWGLATVHWYKEDFQRDEPFAACCSSRLWSVGVATCGDIRALLRPGGAVARCLVGAVVTGRDTCECPAGWPCGLQEGCL